MTSEIFAYDLIDNSFKMHIGVLMHEIGINAKMSYGTSGSSATDSNAASAMAKMGYKKPSVVSYNIATVKSSIEAKKPVYIGGSAKKVKSTYYEASDIFHWFPKTKTTYKEGHAWVIDNYFSETAGSLKREFVHCNLGWGGSKNGWYASGIFDTKLGPVHQTDKVPARAAYDEKYYRYNIKIMPNITPN